MNKGRYLFVVVATLLAVSLVLSCAPPAPAPPAPAAPPVAPTPAPPTPVAPKLPPKPELITMSEFDIGTYLYASMGAVASTIHKEFGIKIRVVPIGNSVARAISTRSGATQFWKGCSSYMFCAEGLAEWGTIEWGPQPLQAIYLVNRKTFFSLVTTADSGIKTMADVKGKRVPFIIGNPSINMQTEAWLAFAGLTMDDVELVEFPGFTASMRGMEAGQADVCAQTSVSEYSYKLEASPHGIYWIPLPESDVEGWKRMREICPFLMPLVLTEGAGVSPEHPASGSSYPCMSLVAWEGQDEDVCYWLLKSIIETYDDYKDAHAVLPWWQLENSIKSLNIIPYHKGAVKYFKEIGVWTDELEKRQQELLNRQKVLIEAFKAAEAEFAESGLAATEFPDFWAKKRVEALKAAGILVWG